MILLGNQRGSFNLHIPAVQLLVAVLRNVQAPAEITRTLIIVTLQFSATRQNSLAHLLRMIYKNTFISSFHSNTHNLHTQNTSGVRDMV